MIEAGQVYRHYKGHIYRVVGVAKHSETLEAPVVYSRADGEPDLWVGRRLCLQKLSRTEDRVLNCCRNPI